MDGSYVPMAASACLATVLEIAVIAALAACLLWERRVLVRSLCCGRAAVLDSVRTLWIGSSSRDREIVQVAHEAEKIATGLA